MNHEISVVGYWNIRVNMNYLSFEYYNKHRIAEADYSEYKQLAEYYFNSDRERINSDFHNSLSKFSSISFLLRVDAN